MQRRRKEPMAVLYRLRPHENLHHSRMIRMKMTAPIGAYWRSIAWMLMFRAALRYFSDSDRREDERCDIPEEWNALQHIVNSDSIEHVLSSESPLHSNSSMFLVIMRVTSCRSSLSLSRFELPAAFAVRVSWYSRVVLPMKVSEATVSAKEPTISCTCTHRIQQMRMAFGLCLPSRHMTSRTPSTAHRGRRKLASEDTTCRR